jgi:hypothetical protein
MNGQWPFQERVQTSEETGKAQRKKVNYDKATWTAVLHAQSLYYHIKLIKLFVLKEEKFNKTERPH